MQVTISYTREGDVHTMKTGGGALPELVIDNGPVPPDQRSGTAKQLLGCAAVFCYMSALVGSLEARDVAYSNASATATLEVGGNELGQGRVKKITIDADVSVPEKNADVFARVEKIMRHGCLVTGSLHDGIEMAYNLHREFTA